MTDEIEEAVAAAIWDSQETSEPGDWEITKRVCGEDHWEVKECYQQARAAIAAHKSALAKAGLKILPREPTQEMGGGPRAKMIWRDMWDEYPDA